MKKVYICPVTDRVRFDNGSDVMLGGGVAGPLTAASNPGGPGVTTAPVRNTLIVK